MNLKTAIQYAKQYRRNGKSCYIHTVNRHDAEFDTNYGRIYFICEKATYAHGGQSKWYRAYLRFAETGKAVPSELFSTLSLGDGYVAVCAK